MITFKQFLESSAGAHGEYVGDVAEKTMVHAIINTLFGGQKTEENYDTVYSFLEAPIVEKFYNRFYDAFAEKAKASEAARKGQPEVTISPESGERLGEFKNQLKQTFNAWKSLNESTPSKIKPKTASGKRAYRDYTNFKGVGGKKELKAEMDREMVKFKDSDHKSKDSYPEDWTADQKYKAKLKKAGKTLPKSKYTDKYHQMYGNKK